MSDDLDPTDVRRLLDERAIRDAALRYGFCLDARDWDGVADTFSADAWIDYQDLTPGPRDEFLPRLRSAIGQFATTQHFLTGQRFEWDDAGAEVLSYAWAFHRVVDAEGVAVLDLTAGVHYRDRYEQRDGRWLCTRRTVVTPWLRQDPVGSGAPMVPPGLD
jgi:hypothetical protein